MFKLCVLFLASVCLVYAIRIEVRQADYYNPYYDGHHDQYQAVPVKVVKKPKEHEKGQDLSKVPGVPGVDYPIYHSVPKTGFSCHNVPAHPGMYANVETGCQAYHVCHDGREGHQGASFLCTNGTLFNQKEFTCDWWYNVDCHSAVNYYRLNLDPEKNPYFPKKKVEEEKEVQYAPDPAYRGHF